MKLTKSKRLLKTPVEKRKLSSSLYLSVLFKGAYVVQTDGFLSVCICLQEVSIFKERADLQNWFLPCVKEYLRKNIFLKVHNLLTSKK